MSQNLSSAAVVIGALRVKKFATRVFFSHIGLGYDFRWNTSVYYPPTGDYSAVSSVYLDFTTTQLAG